MAQRQTRQLDTSSSRPEFPRPHRIGPNAVRWSGAALNAFCAAVGFAQPPFDDALLYSAKKVAAIFDAHPITIWRWARTKRGPRSKPSDVKIQT